MTGFDATDRASTATGRAAASAALAGAAGARHPGRPDRRDQPDRRDRPDPPGRPRAQPHSGAALALVAAAGWPALSTTWLGRWLLQSSDGFTGRANSVVPGGDPGVGLDRALARVHAFYAEQGRSPLFQVRVGTSLEHELRGRGYQVRPSGKEPFGTTDVLVAPLAVVRDRLEALGVPDVGVQFGDLDPAWLSMYGRPTGSPAARHVLGSPERLALARVRAASPGPSSGPTAGLSSGPSSGTTAGLSSVSEVSTGLAGIGRGVVTGRWLGIAAVEVAPSARRRGLARAIIAALVRWAVAEGADWGYLQVGSENVAALTLYTRLGLRLDHSYRYYVPSVSLHMGRKRF